MNVYDKIFQEYKEYIENNSRFVPRIVKAYTSKSTDFPLISCILSNNVDTDYCTNDMIEKYEEYYFTIDIYTKDKTIDGEKVSSQLISDELSNLTMKFFGEKKRMKKTLNQPIPNLDTSILRKTIRYQCLIGNVRENIIRR